jgi:hypothetical protein
MGPMTVKRFLDPETRSTAVMHPPKEPDQTAVVQCTTSTASSRRRSGPLISFSISSDRISSSETRCHRRKVGGPLQVSRLQRPAREKKESVFDSVVIRADDKGSWRY